MVRIRAPWGIASELRTADLLLKQVTTSTLGVRNLADTENRGLTLNKVEMQYLTYYTSIGYLQSSAGATYSVLLRSHNGSAYQDCITLKGGLAELARAKLTGALDAGGKDITDLAVASNLYPLLTPAGLRLSTVTGSFTNPGNSVDGDPATIATAGTADMFISCELPYKSRVREFRHYGHASNSADGTLDLQYWDGAAWQNLNTGIATRGATWSNWIKLTAVVQTTGLRIYARTIDGSGTTRIGEAEFAG